MLIDFFQLIKYSVDASVLRKIPFGSFTIFIAMLIARIDLLRRIVLGVQRERQHNLEPHKEIRTR